MSRILKLQSLASHAALDSNCKMMHGSLITRGNKVYATGCNDNMRGRFQGKNDCCMHAEMAVCNTFINRYVRVDQKKYCVLWGRKKAKKPKV